jgi:hypothetical protein
MAVAPSDVVMLVRISHNYTLVEYTALEKFTPKIELATFDLG